MKRCGTCEFWEPPKEEGEVRGTCSKITTLPGDDNESLVGVEIFGYLLPNWGIPADGESRFTPGARFGCILHKEGEDAG